MALRTWKNVYYLYCTWEIAQVNTFNWRIKSWNVPNKSVLLCDLKWLSISTKRSCPSFLHTSKMACQVHKLNFNKLIKLGLSYDRHNRHSKILWGFLNLFKDKTYISYKGDVIKWLFYLLWLLIKKWNWIFVYLEFLFTLKTYLFHILMLYTVVIYKKNNTVATKFMFKVFNKQ